MKKYDYSKLYGKIKEKGFTQESLSRRVDISESSLNLKLKNIRPFKQDEMLEMCDALDIPLDSVADYFFAPII